MINTTHSHACESQSHACDIKPCPFCGGEAKVMNGCACYEPDDYWIRCKKCEAETRICDSEAAAIAAWNMRADDA